MDADARCFAICRTSFWFGLAVGAESDSGCAVPCGDEREGLLVCRVSHAGSCSTSVVKP